MKSLKKYFFLLIVVISWNIPLSGQHVKGTTAQVDEAIRLLHLADSLSETEQRQKAFEYAQQAASSFERAELWQKYWEANLLLAGISDYLGAQEQRLQYIHEVLERKKDQPEPLPGLLGLAYRYKGEVMISKGLLDSAQNYIQKSMGLLRQANLWDEYAFAYILTAVVDLNKEAFAAMELNLDSALAIADEHLEPGSSVYTVAYNLLVPYYKGIGEYDRAVDMVNKALGTLQTAQEWSLSDSVFLEGLYHNLGVIYSYKGDFDQAILYYQKALGLGDQLPRQTTERDAATYLSIGIALVEKAAFKKSVDYFYRAINDAIRANTKTTLAQAYQGICFAFNEQNLRDSSSRYLNLLRELDKDGDYPKKDITYRQIGIFHRDQGNYAYAIDTISLALELGRKKYEEPHPELTVSYSYLAEIYFLWDSLEQALQTYQEALKMYGLESGRNPLFSNPKLETLSKDPQTQNAIKGKARTLYRLFLKNKEKKYLEAAFSTYSLAINLTDALRLGYKAEGSKLRLMREELSVYEGGIATAIELYHLAGDKEYLKKAFEFAEKSKAVLLLQEVKSSGAKSLAGVPQSLLQQEKQLKIDLAFYRAELQKAEKAKNDRLLKLYQSYLFDLTSSFDSLKMTLEHDFPLYYKLTYNTETTPVAAVQQKLLGSDMAMIEFVEGDTAIYALLITQNDIFAHVLPKPETFESLMSAFQQGLTDHELIIQSPEKSWQLYVPAANGLYQLLLKPLITDLPEGTKRLIVVPDGALGYIPFEALLTDQVPQQNAGFLTLPYLIRDYTISYGYSASLLTESLDRPRRRLRKGECLAMAPEYDKDGAMTVDGGRGLRFKLGPLPYAKEEVTSIEQYFDGEFLLNKEADKGSFLKYAGSYSIIHLAMHGIIDHEQPMQSKLAFVKAETDEETYLYAYELLGQSLFADLVVLSACESGYGRLDRGEGIMSLARNFIHAGANGVVMSLWKVSDKASANIMGHFYQSLAAHKTVDQALKQAKLNYLEDADDLTAHPFYWAEFIGIGQQRVSSSDWMNYWIGGGIIILLLGGIFFFVKRKNSK